MISRLDYPANDACNGDNPPFAAKGTFNVVHKYNVALRGKGRPGLLSTREDPSPASEFLPVMLPTGDICLPSHLPVQTGLGSGH